MPDQNFLHAYLSIVSLSLLSYVVAKTQCPLNGHSLFEGISLIVNHRGDQVKLCSWVNSAIEFACFYNL